MKQASYFHYITLGVICQVFLSILGFITPVSADANNFQFSDYTADYYLEKTTEASKLKVVEQLTAEFPSYNQNHGIERAIPFTNQGGANLTAPSIADLNFTATRNGQSEPVTQSESGSNYYTFRLGDSDAYVHGTQKYQLSYEFTNVVTDQSSDQGAFQELYWDTNGTGWAQPFGRVTANFHLSSDLLDHLHGDTWCYAGTKGSSDQSRCTTTRTSDGFTFTAASLASHENLTFVVNFDADTFTVPAPRTSPIVIIFFIISLIVLAVSIITFIIYYRKHVAARRSYCRRLLTPPQYIPYPGFTVADASQIYRGRIRSPQVATLLELAVTHKLSLIKADKKTWKIRTRDLTGLTPAQNAVLEILAGSPITQPDYEFTIQRRSYSREDDQRSRTFHTSVSDRLQKEQYLEPTQKIGKAAVILLITTVIECALAVNAVTATNQSSAIACSSLAFGVAAVALLNFALICMYGYFKQKYTRHTQKGFDLANYYQGLKDYIQLAETDRLKVLQSVEGVEVTPQNIVKLYEKLLPYAALFGLEKSWLATLNKYYEDNPDLSTDWCTGTIFFTMRDFNSFSSSTSSSYSSASTSSSDSGSGGGGFSGGGGGGGGGGGW